MPSPYDLIQQARRGHSALEALPRQEQWVSMQTGTNDRMLDIPAVDPEPMYRQHSVPTQSASPQAAPPLVPPPTPLYPQISPPGASRTSYAEQQPQYAPSPYSPPCIPYASPYQQPAPPYQPPAQPYVQQQYDQQLYASQYAPPPQYQPHPNLIDPPEPIFAGRPQVVSWNKPGSPKKPRSSYPPAGTPFAQTQAQPTSNYMIPPPTASQGKHVHLDRIHQRHDDALKDIVFHTIADGPLEEQPVPADNPNGE